MCACAVSDGDAVADGAHDEAAPRAGDVPSSIRDLHELRELYLANEHLLPLRELSCRRMNQRDSQYVTCS